MGEMIKWEVTCHQKALLFGGLRSHDNFCGPDSI